MIAELVLAGALAFTGQTDEGERVQVTVSRSGVVTRVVGSVRAYECDDFGDVGPARFDVRPRARVDGRGRFSFVAGDRAERVGVAGRVRAGGRLTGRVRMSGTIATGQRCASPMLRFVLRGGGRARSRSLSRPGL